MILQATLVQRVHCLHAEKSGLKIRFAPMRIKVGNETILRVYAL